MNYPCVCVCMRALVAGAFGQLSITPALAQNYTFSLSSNRYGDDRRTLAVRYHSLRERKRGSESERDGSACARDLSLNRETERERDEYLCSETCSSKSSGHTDPEETRGKTETGEGFRFCIRYKIRPD